MDEMKDKFVQLYGSFENIKDEDQFIFWAYYGLMLQSIGHESDAEKYYLNVINNCKRTPASSEAYLPRRIPDRSRQGGDDLRCVRECSRLRQRRDSPCAFRHEKDGG